MAGQKRQSRMSLKFLRAGIALLPLAGDKVQNVPLIWPPLGSIETYMAGLAAVLIGIVGALPISFRTKTIAKAWARAGLLFAFVSLLVYGGFLLRYVKSVETPHNGTQYRTVGGQRTAEAFQKFPASSDEEILEQAGLTDGDIERMWTPSSVWFARLGLFASYLAALTSVNFAVGAFARASPKATGAKDVE